MVSRAVYARPFNPQRRISHQGAKCLPQPLLSDPWFVTSIRPPRSPPERNEMRKRPFVLTIKTFCSARRHSASIILAGHCLASCITKAQDIGSTRNSSILIVLSLIHHGDHHPSTAIWRLDVPSGAGGPLDTRTLGLKPTAIPFVSWYPFPEHNGAGSKHLSSIPLFMPHGCK